MNPKITEKSGFIAERKNYDHVTYICNGMNTESQKKLEDKMKIKINIPSNSDKIYEINECQSIIWISKWIRTDDQKQKAAELIKQLAQYCSNRKFERTAICLSMKDAQSYFEIKQYLRNSFKNLDISITIFQDKIIEVTSIEDINEILSSYHKTLLGGHIGISRMKGNIKKFYNWPTMTKDVKQFVRDRPICVF